VLLDTIENYSNSQVAKVNEIQNSYNAIERARLYKAMGQTKKWFELMYNNYKQNPRSNSFDNLIAECLRNGMLVECRKLLNENSKGKKKYEHYCWMEIIPLMKAGKYKEAELKFKKILAKYSKNFDVLDMMYCDIIDACNGLKNKADRKFLMYLQSDILTPMRSKGYTF